MFPRSRRSILGLVLGSAVLLAAAPELATPASAAPRVSAVSASLQTHTVLVTGSRFQPGSTVSLSLVRVVSSKERAILVVIARRSTHAQYATIGCPGPGMAPGCSVPNPKAGTISVRMHVKQLHRIADLMVLYRSPERSGLGAVTAQ